MKITNAYVNITSPGRNFVTFKIETDEGHLRPRGWHAQRARASRGVLPHRSRDSLHHWSRSLSDRRHMAVPLSRSHIGGGPGHDGRNRSRGRRALGHQGQGAQHSRLQPARRQEPRGHAGVLPCERQGRRAALEDVAKHTELGYKAIRVQSGVPGLNSTYGVAKGPGRYEPAERGLPHEYEWATEPYLRDVPKLFARVREEFGEELHLLHDCHHRLTPIEAGASGQGTRAISPVLDGGSLRRPNYRKASSSSANTQPPRLRWARCSIPSGMRTISSAINGSTTSALTIMHGGGITHLKKAADFAALYHVRTGCHGATDLSPVRMAAALHFDTAIHNFGIQEHMPHPMRPRRVSAPVHIQRRHDVSR